MNTWQAMQQVRYLLELREWPGSSTLVFPSGSVVIVSEMSDHVMSVVRKPCVMLRAASMGHDPNKPGLIKQDIGIRLCVSHAGDATGETAVIGGHRSGQTESQGRGLLEIEEQVHATMKLLGSDSGIESQFVAASAQHSLRVGEAPIVYREYVWQLDTTLERFYAPVTCLEEA